MGISLLTCLEITNFYPDEILIEGERVENGKWVGKIYRL